MSRGEGLKEGERGEGHNAHEQERAKGRGSESENPKQAPC